MSFSADDHRFMARALQLAARGLYTTDPNPRVGCVLVRDGDIVGEAWHQRAGEPHAEPLALRQAGASAQGATAYVTLEPCSHFGRTPPCADALIAAGVSRVVVAMQDPNPLVAGQGLERLQQAGIAVECGVLEAQATALNPGFIQRMRVGRPFVRLKLAMSLDGRTAMRSGESQWITGSAARADVQRLRARSSAIITGIDSVCLDDPQLTVRDPDLLSEGTALQPLRVVLDSHLRLSPSARVLQVPGKVLLVTSDQVAPAQVAALASDNVDRLALPLDDQGRIPLAPVLQHLAQSCQSNEVLVETGATLAGSFMAQGLVDELVVYMAPTLLGSDARPLLQMPLTQMAQQQRLQLTDVRHFGDDLRLTYKPLTER